MRLGLFMMPLHPPTRTLGDYMVETAEKVLLAERLGFDEVYVGEHFSATTEPIPSPLMFMASLIPQTSRITFGTGVINLPNRHPAVIAAEVAQFDHMSQGRFLFGIGTGSLPSDYELFDVADVEKRNRMLIESMDMIAQIWAQDPPYEFNGEFWQFGIRKAINRELGIGFMPKPFRPGGPPVCVAVSSPNSHTVRVAAQRGWSPSQARSRRTTCWRLTGRAMPPNVLLPVVLPSATSGGSRPTSWSRVRTRRRASACSRRTAHTATPSAISTRCSNDRGVSPISSRAATCGMRT